MSAGLAAHEVLLVLGVLGIFAALLLPRVLKWQARSRDIRCQANLAQLSLALHAYEEVYDAFPPAAVWHPAGEHFGPLHELKRVDLVSHENWTILLLPFLDHGPLAAQWQVGKPIGDDVHEELRLSTLSQLRCPSDDYSVPSNPYRLSTGASNQVVEFARGNYAINGGTHNAQFDKPSTTAPRGETMTLVMDAVTREYALWGNGVAGINRSFARDEFTNGTGTLIAFEELRAGIHPVDPRGTWALGQIGASITWGHGVNGDAYRPNHPWKRADDVQGCDQLHADLGEQRLVDLGMPCVDYVHFNRQATSRSRHAGGVHVAFLDGQVRLLANDIDPGVWHALHSRETPGDMLAGAIEARMAATIFTEHPAGEPAGTPVGPVVNSVGMEFVLVPAGDFLLGRADYGFVPVDDSPPRPCRITQPYLLQAREVSLGQFEEVMGRLPLAMGDGAQLKPFHFKRPCVDLTWNEAHEFCAQLTELETPLGRRYRLPSEAEWEFACREGQDRPFRYQATRPKDDPSGIAAGVEPARKLTACGSYPPNALGLYDMRGNAWEWCQDWFSRTYIGPVDNPRGPASGYLKVVRGCDWRFVGEPCQIDYPMMPPFKSNPFVGFRVVCELIPPP
ncbi:MAG: SUMF1/EgtB/PvdO family nonheme iron enzyme [Planctomycetaceae bacterium]|nr:SUMF1/EgtB/PvdO family nonheme iron enzyme [Planctomycetaceae bacterium]